METLILTRSEIERALSPAALLDALRSAFAAYSTQRSIDAMRIPVPLPQQRAGASGMLLAPGHINLFQHGPNNTSPKKLGSGPRSVIVDSFTFKAAK